MRSNLIDPDEWNACEVRGLRPTGLFVDDLPRIEWFRGTDGEQGRTSLPSRPFSGFVADRRASRLSIRVADDVRTSLAGLGLLGMIATPDGFTFELQPCQVDALNAANPNFSFDFMRRA